MTIELIGHKRSLVPAILDAVQRGAPGERCVADLFSGSGTVSAAFKSAGYQVFAVDNLEWCRLFAEAILLNDGEPKFEGVLAEIGTGHVPRLIASPYDEVLAYLNHLEPSEGFVFNHYSPASEETQGVARMYFTESSAGVIDSVRSEIDGWAARMTRAERALLLVSLLRGANAVSNVAGTYGSYLKTWKPKALGRLVLVRQPITAGASLGHRVLRADANRAAAHVGAGVVYADPPYTKRQYAAYYHVLETIARNDSPRLTGSTGLRPWRNQASDYCYKSKAPRALADLLERLRCRHFFLSYNEDG